MEKKGGCLNLIIFLNQTLYLQYSTFKLNIISTVKETYRYLQYSRRGGKARQDSVAGASSGTRAAMRHPSPLIKKGKFLRIVFTKLPMHPLTLSFYL